MSYLNCLYFHFLILEMVCSGFLAEGFAGKITRKPEAHTIFCGTCLHRRISAQEEKQRRMSGRVYPGRTIVMVPHFLQSHQQQKFPPKNQKTALSHTAEQTLVEDVFIKMKMFLLNTGSLLCARFVVCGRQKLLPALHSENKTAIREQFLMPAQC